MTDTPFENTTEIPDANIEEAQGFLTASNKRGTHHLVAIKEGCPPISRSFRRDNVKGLEKWMEKMNSKEFNIYFHVNMLRDGAENIKASKQDIVGAVMVHVDIDDPSKQSLKGLHAFSPPPSFIVFSGGGYQGFWLLEGIEKDLRGVEDANSAVAQNLGGDNCHNIDRIMRVPGTVNWPNAKKRAMGRIPTLAKWIRNLSNEEQTYKLSNFPKSSTVLLTQENDRAKLDPNNIQIRDVSEFELSEDDHLTKLIVEGDDSERPIGTPNSHFPSRSEVVFAVAVGLARRRIGPLEIAGLLCNPDYRISRSILEKSNPRTYALRQAVRANTFISTDWPVVGKSGKPFRSLPNTLAGLVRMKIRFSNDQFHNRKRVEGHQIQSFEGDLTDDGMAYLRKMFIDEHGFDPGKGNIMDAAQILCLEDSYHPILDYLNGLDWDGISRLEALFPDYFNTENTPLNRYSGKLMLVAAVQRVMRPGCKFDIMIVIEGPQGTGKSSALRILAGPDNFSDQNLFVLDDKAQMEALEGVWIFEVAELDGMSHAETSKVKAMITRTEDRGRPAYARYKESWARQSILVGTTNEDFYLKDATGNRRFLPVKAGIIDLEGLQRDRDQLWAEAAHLAADGFSIDLPKEFWVAAELQQNQRTQEDPWYDLLADINGTIEGSVERVSTRLLFSEVYLNIPASHQKGYHPKRLAQNMRKLGWTGPHKLRIDGKVVRGYERPLENGQNEAF